MASNSAPAAGSAVAVHVTVAGAPRWLIAALGGPAAVATGLRQPFHLEEKRIVRAVAAETISGHSARSST